MSLPKYAEYKDSGVAWLGDVPAHWDIAPLKRMLEIQNGSDHKHIEVDGDGYPVIGSGGPFALASEYIHDGESVLLGRKGTVDRPLYVTGKFWTVDTMYWTKISPDANGKFCYYAALTIPFDLYSTNTALPSMTKGVLNAHPIARPSSAEQSVIAAFLDRETGKIDALIAEQEKLLTLLAEKRQATISHAVTRGLNPNAPVKDSGVPWMGEVPAHWAIAKLGHFATVENGTTPSRIVEDYWQGGDVPWLASGEVNQVFIDESSEFITKMALERCSLRLLPVGTVVVGMIGQGKTRGMAALLRIPATINQNLAAICPGKKVLGEYVLYVLHAVYEWLREAGRGGNQAATNCEILSALRIPVPPIEEQKKIVDFIEFELGKLDSLRFAGEQAINLLKERRGALIAAAVTGNIDVRQVA